MKNKISQLKKENSRFKRVFKEYQIMSEELWDLENSSEVSVSDDFLNAVNIQTDYLQEEIEHWLEAENKKSAP